MITEIKKLHSKLNDSRKDFSVYFSCHDQRVNPEKQKAVFVDSLLFLSVFSNVEQEFSDRDIRTNNIFQFAEQSGLNNFTDFVEKLIYNKKDNLVVKVGSEYAPKNPLKKT